MSQPIESLVQVSYGNGSPDKIVGRGVLIFFGLAWPFFIVHAIASYSVWDITVFKEWADCWGENIYRQCRANYPSVGLIASAGILRAIDAIFGDMDQEASKLAFRYILAIFDSLNFLLFVWLSSLMRLRRPLLIGLALVIIPSTWVGGARWGQIDNIGLFFCLLSVIGFVKTWQANATGGEREKPWVAGTWLLFAVTNLVLYLLSKQLAIFSAPFFLILSLITVRRLVARLHHVGIVWLAVSASVFLLIFYYLDTLFVVPAGFYGSSYWFVWAGGGSDHAHQIARNGFNIWMFLGREMESSSHINFLNFQIWKWRDHLSPYKAGLILYSLFIIVLMVSTFRRVYRILPYSRAIFEMGREQGELIAVLLMFHGLCHLGFNVFMSGTHERYLYLGYPSLLLAVTWFYSRGIWFTWRLTAFCFLAAAAYGGFVFSINAMLPQWLFPLRRHEFIASLHLFLLVVLADRYLRILRGSHYANPMMPRRASPRSSSAP